MKCDSHPHIKNIPPSHRSVNEYEFRFTVNMGRSVTVPSDRKGGPAPFFTWIVAPGSPYPDVWWVTRAVKHVNETTGVEDTAIDREVAVEKNSWKFLSICDIKNIFFVKSVFFKVLFVKYSIRELFFMDCFPCGLFQSFQRKKIAFFLVACACVGRLPDVVLTLQLN